MYKRQVFVSKIAGNPNTLDETLTFLYWHTPFRGPTWQKINSNLACSRMELELALEYELGELLYYSANGELMAIGAEAYLHWEHLHPDIFPLLAESTSWVVLKLLAACSRTPPDILVHLSDLATEEDAQYSEEIDEANLEDAYPEFGPGHVRHEAIENPSHPAEEARRSNSSSELEALLHQFPRHDVRLAVAGNSSAGEQTLTALSQNSEETVRANVARHSNCSRDIAMTLAKDGSTEVRVAVADGPKTSMATLATFYSDPSSDVRMAVLQRKNCPPQFLARLAEDPIEDWRALAAKHRHCPKETLKSLARDRSIAVRKAVMDNKECPLDIRAALFQSLKSG